LSLVVLHPPHYPAERAYALRTVLHEFLGLDYVAAVHDRADVVITLREDSAGRQLRLPDVLFNTPADRWLTNAALPGEPLARWRVPSCLAGEETGSSELPVLYGARADASFYSESAAVTEWGLDIFGSAFLLLSRYEEVVSGARDSHDRFPADASLAFREGFLERPLIDEYVEALWLIIERCWPLLKRKAREDRVLLSHDVDRPLCTAGRSPSWVARSLAADVLRRRDIGLAARRLGSYVRATRGVIQGDPCDTFEFMMTESERRGWRSAFYFMAGGSEPGIDGEYDLSTPWIRRLIRRIGGRQHEIGIHPSYRTYQDPVGTKREFDRLCSIAAEEGVRQERWGGRQHYLRWENPATWQSWDDAGLAYDSTLGFPEHVGFRCGVCREFPAFNLRTREQLELRERPLVVMDQTLFGYMGLEWQPALDRILKLRATCRRLKGDFTLLWHNNGLTSRREQRQYAELCAAL
jgi:hypothetical protein